MKRRGLVDDFTFLVPKSIPEAVAYLFRKGLPALDGIFEYIRAEVEVLSLPPPTLIDLACRRENHTVSIDDHNTKEHRNTA